MKSNPDWKALETNSKIRRSLKNATDFLALGSSSASDRAAAALKLGLKQSLASLPVLESRLSQETEPSAQAAFQDAIALVNLNSDNPEQRIGALQRLGESGSLPSRDAIKRLANDSSQPPPVSRAAREALQSIDARIFWIDFFGTIFRGVSLGTVLLIVALGLAITFGLMGVINMAHGEIMIVGGYATFLVQCVFGNGLAFAPFGLSMNIPGFGFHPSSTVYQSYFLLALPVAFLSAAAIGYVLERGVIRFLYRRPLESLLATWGASLVMQQLFRLIFGPANVPVASPQWMSGSLNIEGVLMNYNRLLVIVFAAVIVLCTSLLLSKTSLGLLIRAVMQDRSMAGCMGVPTAKVNTLTFSFGCGLAGLAGAFLSQIGNIGPGTGQTYIVDAFMVVVLGGIGSLTGTVISALGIGTLDQILQTTLRNPVIGKVLVLIGLILFLQYKPSGLFSAKSRNLEES
jgi:urea transport system permease protein